MSDPKPKYLKITTIEPKVTSRFITYGPRCWNHGSLRRTSRDCLLELLNNGEPVYYTTH